MKNLMNSFGKMAAIMVAVSSLFLGACAVTRDQSTTGQYVDDSVITTQVKAKFVESKAVDASAISVETLQGTVQLSGFAKDANEKASAEKIAKAVEGVKTVKNSIVVKQ